MEIPKVFKDAPHGVFHSPLRLQMFSPPVSTDFELTSSGSPNQSNLVLLHHEKWLPSLDPNLFSTTMNNL